MRRMEYCHAEDPWCIYVFAAHGLGLEMPHVALGHTAEGFVEGLNQNVRPILGWDGTFLWGALFIFKGLLKVSLSSAEIPLHIFYL